MSSRTIYKCDKCGVEKDSRDQFWFVCVLISSDMFPTVQHYGSWSHRKEWCRSCVESAGMLPRVVLKDVPISEPAPTLEDMFREIIREEIQAVQS